MTTQGFLPPRNNPLNPPELLSGLRAHDPISKVTMWDGRKVWLITRYEDARRILRDRRFSSDKDNPRFPVQSPGRAGSRRLMSRMDDPRHREIRRTLVDDFLAGRIEQLRPDIERIVATQIDHLLETTPPVDLHQEFSLAVPTRMISELLGVPSSEQRLFQACTRVIVSATVTRAEFSEADAELYAMCMRLLEQKEAEPSDDLLGRLVVNEVRTGNLSYDDAAAAAMFLIVAGHETTANMISLGTLTILLNPDWFQAMRTQPDVATNAVEELLRFYTPQHDGLPRVAIKDVNINGTLISAGDGVIVCVASGNRDEAVFPDPDKADFKRDGAQRHLAFGDGVHRCLGQWLARAELQTAFPALASRIPTLRLAVPFEELSFNEDSHIFGVRELPVTW
jgi:cytochrome P450